MKLATLVAGILAVSETEAATLLEIGQSEGLSFAETVDLFREEQKPLTFGQMVAAERQFASDHIWSEKRGKWFKPRNRS